MLGAMGQFSLTVHLIFIFFISSCLVAEKHISSSKCFAILSFVTFWIAAVLNNSGA